MKASRLLAFTAAAWLCGVIVGTAMLINYSSAPGLAAAAPSQWPSMVEFPRRSSRLTLLMFVHPHCPCSKASVNELARLVARYRHQIDSTVLFVKPPNSPDDFHRSSLWETAAAIPGVHVVVDHDGIAASRFGAKTSGHCVVYDIGGVLAFSGGITEGRGHEGDSPGQSIIAALANQSTADKPRQCSTFGCALFSNASPPAPTSVIP